MASKTFIARLDSAIEEYSLLKHPFYQAWNAGTLTRETLQEYAKQYYHFERRFPTFVSAVHANTEDIAVRQQLLENLVEEERGTVNHPELWLRFADSLGCDREQLKATPMYAETEALVKTLKTLTRDNDTVGGMAALYGYESQIPEISRTKINGLTSFYNVKSDAGLSFFRVHEQADELHARSERELLESLVATEEDENRAIKSAQTSAKAFYAMLDGIVRECNVACPSMN